MVNTTLEAIDTTQQTVDITQETVVITQETPLSTVIQYLAKHSSVIDLTDELSRSLSVSPCAVARGGFSDIYRATLPNGTQLAIKCLRQHDPKHVKRTARELNTWSRLKHPNILELSGLALFQGYLAMVSPWMESGSVNSAIKRAPELDRYKLCYQLASVIKYLHKTNVVHGDIKGDNLLMAQDGTLKITDFGLAIIQDTVLQFSQTDPGRGTFRWMGRSAPELFNEEPQRSREADVYAMGMTMLEIISGDIPFCEIKYDHMVFAAVVQEKRKPPVPELTQEPVSHQAAILHHVLQWCWEYAPNDRPTARQVALAVEALVSD